MTDLSEKALDDLLVEIGEWEEARGEKLALKPTKIIFRQEDMRFFGLDPNSLEDCAAWQAELERLLVAAGKPSDQVY